MENGKWKMEGGKRSPSRRSLARVTRDEAALTDLQQTLAKAWVSGDRAAIERIIAPDWKSTGPDGRMTDGATVLIQVFERRTHIIRRLSKLTT
jgi:Domain of unknown function (DUF4440)